MSTIKPTLETILRVLGDAVVQTVKDYEQVAPWGCPGGHLYAMLMCHGLSLEAFESLMGGLVDAGKLKKLGDCYKIP